jgi:hypothetical protein
VEEIVALCYDDKMVKYKYLVITFETDDSLQTIENTTLLLTKQGEAGWELVSVVPISDYKGEKSLFYFKQPISH